MKIMNNLRYFDETYNRSYVMRCDQLYTALGLDPKKHLPDAGLAAQYVGDVKVWVDPKIQGVNQDAKRVWCECPICTRVLTAGKLQQHLKVHKE